MASTVVGLDIGRTAVRAVELRGKTPVLRRHGSVPLERGAVETGVVADPLQVTEACRRLWKEGRFSSRDVRLGISSGSVLVRQIELDWMPPADLKRALRYQVAELLPVAVDDANLDHVLLGEVTRRDESGQERRMVRILLVATARGAVDEMVRAVRAAGLRARTADLAPLALVRAAAAASRREEARAGSTTPGPARTEAVIDVGSDKVAVAVHTAGVPHFVRVAAGLGGDGLTQTLVSATGMEWDQAERLKREASLEHEATLRHATTRLVGEIRATLDFYSDTDPEHEVSSVVVTGAGAAHPAFRETCARTLGLPVRPLSLASVVDGVAPGRAQKSAPTEPPTDDLVVPAALCLGAIA